MILSLSYNHCSCVKVNGSFACENNATINGMLKTEFGFQGCTSSILICSMYKNPKFLFARPYVGLVGNTLDYTFGKRWSRR